MERGREGEIMVFLSLFFFFSFFLFFFTDPQQQQHTDNALFFGRFFFLQVHNVNLHSARFVIKKKEKQKWGKRVGGERVFFVFFVISVPFFFSFFSAERKQKAVNFSSARTTMTRRRAPGPRAGGARTVVAAAGSRCGRSRCCCCCSCSSSSSSSFSSCSSSPLPPPVTASAADSPPVPERAVVSVDGEPRPHETHELAPELCSSLSPAAASSASSSCYSSLEKGREGTSSRGSGGDGGGGDPSRFGRLRSFCSFLRRSRCRRRDEARKSVRPPEALDDGRGDVGGVPLRSAEQGLEVPAAPERDPGRHGPGGRGRRGGEPRGGRRGGGGGSAGGDIAAVAVAVATAAAVAPPPAGPLEAPAVDLAPPLQARLFLFFFPSLLRDEAPRRPCWRRRPPPSRFSREPGDSARVGSSRGGGAPPSDSRPALAAIGIHGGSRRDPVPQAPSGRSFVVVVIALPAPGRCYLFSDLDRCCDLGLRPPPVDEARHPLQAQRAGAFSAFQQPLLDARDAEGRVAAGQQRAAEREALRRREADGAAAVVVGGVGIVDFVAEIISPPLLLGGSRCRLEHLERDVIFVLHNALERTRAKEARPRPRSLETSFFLFAQTF